MSGEDTAAMVAPRCESSHRWGFFIDSDKAGTTYVIVVYAMLHG